MTEPKWGLSREQRLVLQVGGPLLIVAIHLGVWTFTGSHGAAFLYGIVPILLLLPRVRLPEDAASPREERHGSYWSNTVEAFGGMRVVGSVVVALLVVGGIGALLGWYSLDGLLLVVGGLAGFALLAVIGAAVWNVGQRN